MGPPRRETSAAAGQHEGGDDVHGRHQHGPWTAGHAGADRARGQDGVCLARAALAGAHSSRHFGERLGHDDHDPAARGQSGQRDESRQGGQSWILLWDMASLHASEATLAAMRAAFPHVVLCFLPPRSTSYLQPCDVAVFRSFKSCIQTQASATLARSVLDGSFEGLVMNKAWRRQSSAEWASRAATDLCDENKARTTGWHRLRAGSNAEFREGVAEAAALHAHDELFSKHIEPEPPPEDPVEWAMAEATDDEDDAPMPDAPPEPELIDMPPAPASAPCTALDHAESQQKCTTIIISHCALCCLTCPLSRVWCLSVVESVGVWPRFPD